MALLQAIDRETGFGVTRRCDELDGLFSSRPVAGQKRAICSFRAVHDVERPTAAQQEKKKSNAMS